MQPKKMRGLMLLLVTYLRDNGQWVSKGQLTADMVWKHPTGKNYGKRYLPETVGRMLRHLEELSVIAVKDDGISVQYRWIAPDWRARYITSSERTNSSGQTDLTLFREDKEC